MQDQLVGYMLGALDATEKQEVEKHLAKDGELQQQLLLLRKCVEPLDQDHGHLAPPLGLAQRTCDLVQSYRPETRATAVGSSASSVRASDAPPPAHRWSLVDVAVAAGVVFAAALLVIPGISYSQFNAKLASCQNNLKDIGLAIHQYSEQNPNGFIPEIPTEGPYSVAGVYAPKLLEMGLVEDSRIFYCAASDLASRPQPPEIPTWGELVSLKGDTSKKLDGQLSNLGGSYAYNLGFVQNGQYQTVSLKDHNRKTFVLMADTPCQTLKWSQSNNHGGFGQNVLFEDGRVKYLTTCSGPDGSDKDFFHNNDGQIAAGRNADDSVVGCSSESPLK